MNNKLNVQAIFDSIDGEENAFDGAGQLTTFIRLKGCNFHRYGGCSYCDTKYAQNPKPENWMTIDEIVQQIHFPKVTITGGEPMMQREGVVELLSRLITKHKVTVETNGSQLLPVLYAYSPEYIRFVVDYKLESSGMLEHMNSKIFKNLRAIDVIKFVITDEYDYKYALTVIGQNHNWIAKKVFSPAVRIKWVLDGPQRHPAQKSVIDNRWPRQLAEMMIRDKVDAQFSLQLHKILWPGAREER